MELSKSGKGEGFQKIPFEKILGDNLYFYYIDYIETLKGSGCSLFRRALFSLDWLRNPDSDISDVGGAAYRRKIGVVYLVIALLKPLTLQWNVLSRELIKCKSNKNGHFIIWELSQPIEINTATEDDK